MPYIPPKEEVSTWSADDLFEYFKNHHGTITEDQREKPRQAEYHGLSLLRCAGDSSRLDRLGIPLGTSDYLAGLAELIVNSNLAPAQDKGRRKGEATFLAKWTLANISQHLT